MASEKATYWMAVGVLALLVGNHFISKLDSLCLRGRALYAVERLSDSASRMSDRTQGMVDRESGRYAHVQSRVAFAQSRIASVQSLMARKEAALAQAQALREQRILMMDQVRNSVRCPRPRIQVAVPELPSRLSDDSI
jgi:hypothetical protein